MPLRRFDGKISPQRDHRRRFPDLGLGRAESHRSRKGEGVKLREEHVQRICKTVLSRWKEKRMIRAKAPDDVLLAKMIGEIQKDFQREEALDREVEALMEKHSREMSLSQANARVLFQKIKDRLAEERGIVL
ncbi:MAG: hypothetical protein C3F14_00910 [Deltaproteobacteria bacterium]|nr:MAG: hypothetical protein C3F14_00910 [Deltaproteobacteria bacterium]